jgi:hypothetical protein
MTRSLRPSRLASSTRERQSRWRSDSGLIDELRPILHPVALGRGAGLFEGIVQRRDLELVDSERTPPAAST